MSSKLSSLPNILKRLPQWTFALTFGASLVATAIMVCALLFIALLPWPDEAATARTTALMWLGLSQTLITLVVIVSWTFGRLDTFSFNAGMFSGSIDFQDDDAIDQDAEKLSKQVAPNATPTQTTMNMEPPY